MSYYSRSYKTIVGFAMILGLNLLFAFPFKWAWNYVIPDLTGLPILLTWGKSWCLLFVVYSLFSPIHIIDNSD